MTHEESLNLLQHKKYLVKNDKRCDDIFLYLDFSNSKKYQLACEETNEKFIWQISQSQKTKIKINLHIQEKESVTGLMRIDYNNASKHKNPEDILPDVPSAFRAYAGILIDESHIHYHIDGYKSLAWAIPLSDDAFEVKTITEEYLNKEFERSIRCFAQAITLITKITIP